MKRSLRTSPQNHNHLKKWLPPTIIIFLYLCAWVWRGYYHQRLQDDLMLLLNTEDSLLTRAAHLNRQLLGLSEFAQVERRAREELGMRLPKIPPDTLWVKELPDPPVQLGSLALIQKTENHR